MVYFLITGCETKSSIDNDSKSSKEAGPKKGNVKIKAKIFEPNQ